MFFVLHLFTFASNLNGMTFDNIHEHLWAVRFDGEPDNELSILFDKWNDVYYLNDFFKRNKKILQNYFHVTVSEAIIDTLDDSKYLEDVILDLKPESNLDHIFTALSGKEYSYLGRSKAKRFGKKTHDCWLRVYAIKLESGTYIITGGAIKLTQKMQDAEHTVIELNKIKQCRDFLVSQGVIDIDSFKEVVIENQ